MTVMNLVVFVTTQRLDVRWIYAQAYCTVVVKVKLFR